MDDDEFLEDDLIEDAEMTTLQEMAYITHELYEAYLEAGFSPGQALWLSSTYQADLTTPEG